MNFHIHYRIFLIFLFATIFIFPAFAQKGTIRLFHIERNKNQHIVCYDLNIVDGKINEKSPIHIYWVSHPENKKSELSFIENKLAYGAKTKLVNPQTLVITMNVLKEPEITVSYHPETKEVGTIATVNDKTVRLEKISIIAKPPRYTSVERVDIYGTRISTGEKIVESIKG